MAKKKMADLSKYAPPDAKGIRWVDAKDSNGVVYRHGFLDANTIKESAGNRASEDVKASDDGKVAVNWPLGTSGDVSPPVRNVIAYAFFSLPDHPIFDYQFSFCVNGGWERIFTDDKDADYTCATLFNGWHYIQFSSPSTSPCICYVS